MSDQVSQNRKKQPSLRHYSDQNDLTQLHSPFNRRSYYPHPSAISGHGGHLLLVHRHQSFRNSSYPPPTANLRFGMWSGGGAKAYFRFHGGIGDGCGGAGCWAIRENTITRPLQLFEALNPAHFQIDMFKKASYVNPMTGKWVPFMEATAGTGVFMPMYPKKIGFTKADDLKNNGVMCIGGGGHGGRNSRQMKQEEEKHLGEEEVGTVFDEIPIELLLPPEWTY